MADSRPEEDKQSKKLFPIFQTNFRPVKQTDPLQEIQLTLEKSQEKTKRRKNLLGKKETPGLTQMILDAGQKVIGPVYCEECGLLYTPGEIEDEREHQKAHNRIENLFVIRLWKDVKIVQNFPVEGCIIIAVNCATESKRVLSSLKDLLAWLDSELGGSHDECGSKPTERIYLYAFRTKRKNVFRVLGCAVIESIEKDQVSIQPLVEKLEPEPVQENITIGLTRLWTDSSFRRRKIATRLCDAICISWSVLPGYVIPKNKLGILEPSEDGKLFMEKYTNRNGYLYTYNF